MGKSMRKSIGEGYWAMGSAHYNDHPIKDVMLLTGLSIFGVNYLQSGRLGLIAPILTFASYF